MPAIAEVVEDQWPRDPAIAAALARVVEELRADPEAMVATVLTGMRREVPRYAAMAEEAARVVDQGVTHTVTTFVTLLAEQRRLRPDELEGIAAIGTTRAGQGVPVADMLQAVRVAMRWGWAHILYLASALPPGPAATAAVGRLGAEVFEYMQQTASAMARGAEEHLLRGLGADMRARSHVVEELLSGAFRSDEELTGLAAAVGLDLTAPYTLVLAAFPLGDDDRLTPLRRIEDEVVSRFLGILGSSVRSAPTPHVVVAVDPAFAAGVVEAILAVGAMVAIGDPVTRPSALHACYKRTATLLDVARRFRHPGGVIDGRRLAAHRLLGGADPEGARMFVEDVLGPVLDLPPDRRQRLIDVLEAAAATDGTLNEIGAYLGIHAKTAGVRIREVESQTGLRLDHLDDRLLVELALVLLRLH